MNFRRLNFAKKHEDWIAEQWGEALFSGESLVQPFVLRIRHVRRSSGKRLDEEYTASTLSSRLDRWLWVQYAIPHGWIVLTDP